MTLERYAWWLVMAWCVWRAWSANAKAEAAAIRPCNCNEAGSAMIARCVLKIDTARRFAPPSSGFVVEGSHPFKIGDRRFLLIVRERFDG